jgi:hypothetical protein
MAFRRSGDRLPSAHCEGAVGGAGINYLSRMGKQEGPTLVARKCGHEFRIS